MWRNWLHPDTAVVGMSNGAAATKSSQKVGYRTGDPGIQLPGTRHTDTRHRCSQQTVPSQRGSSETWNSIYHKRNEATPHGRTMNITDRARHRALETLGTDKPTQKLQALRAEGRGGWGDFEQ